MSLYVVWQKKSSSGLSHSRLVWGNDFEDAAQKLARGETYGGIPDGLDPKLPVLFAKVKLSTSQTFRLKRPDRYDFEEWK